ncbi:MAG: hypothetical protein O7C39_02730, partial [Bacteroidetes bacterium]|nr:hypothetical protein [Bacteroidota bacterium]
MVRTTDMVIDCRRDKKPYPLREYTKLIENRGTLKLMIFSSERDDSYGALTVFGMTIDLSYIPLSAALRAPVR